jgi:hypothetical protein
VESLLSYYAVHDERSTFLSLETSRAAQVLLSSTWASLIYSREGNPLKHAAHPRTTSVEKPNILSGLSGTLRLLPFGMLQQPREAVPSSEPRKQVMLEHSRLAQMRSNEKSTSLTHMLDLHLLTSLVSDRRDRTGLMVGEQLLKPMSQRFPVIPTPHR